MSQKASYPKAIVKHRGHTITVTREPCLAGYDLTYFHIVRDSDGFFVEDSFTEEDTPPAEYAEGLKERVDNEIAEAEKEWSEWLNKFYESIASSLRQSVEEVRAMGWDESALREQFDDGEFPEDAADEEYYAMVT